MGRKESDDLSAAQIFYPCMQCADVFFLKADICQLGMDQRKVNMLAREYCDAAEPKIKFKPIILSHRAWGAHLSPAPSLPLGHGSLWGAPRGGRLSLRTPLPHPPRPLT